MEKMNCWLKQMTKSEKIILKIEVNEMIFDKIVNRENYRDYPELYRVLCYLASLKTDELPLPNTVLVKDKIFCNPVKFVSKPEEQCKYEIHRKYIDLHYIVKGVEGIATADVNKLEVDTPFDEDKDIGFYTGKEDGRYYLRSGDFMVCYPSDAHKVGMMENEPQSVEKIVVKIRFDEVTENKCEKQNVMDKIHKKLIVSCQALPHEPLYSSFIMGRMARAAKEGGAFGIRANTKEDIKEIQRQVDLPVIGIVKRDYENCKVYITPTMKEIDELMEVKPEIIAIDATKSLRPNGQTLDAFFYEIKKKYPDQLFMADCSTVNEALHADKIGFDFIGTTLVGYTEQSAGMKIENNDFKIIREILSNVKHPVIAEGNINTPEKVKRVIELGCYSVVVGSIITRPQLITKAFAEALENIK